MLTFRSSIKPTLMKFALWRGEFVNHDIGLEVGLFEWHDFKCELGVDYYGGADDPVNFNAKVGMGEDKLFKHAPSFNVGIFYCGTRRKGPLPTNDNIVDFIFGKSLPESIGGKVFIGAYSGSHSMGPVTKGILLGYEYNFWEAKDCHGEKYNKLRFAADWATGKNIIGGGGIGFVYYFTPDITITTGPAFFLDTKINGRWKWILELDILFDAYTKYFKKEA